tara:strand:+ start:440 stop:802 length:363 start_codon:yes stop_codon:yes gene_type:complete
MGDTRRVIGEVRWSNDNVLMVEIEYSKLFQSIVIKAQELMLNNTTIRGVELSALVRNHIKILELLDDWLDVIDDFNIAFFDVLVKSEGVFLTIYNKHEVAPQIGVRFSNDILLEKEVSHG